MSSDDLLINIKFFFEFFLAWLETCFGEEGETLAGAHEKISSPERSETEPLKNLEN